MSRPSARWAAPVVAAALVVGLPWATSLQANAEPPLPARTAQQLLVDVQGLKPRPLAGEVRTVGNLGLPELTGVVAPRLKDASPGSLLWLASGTHQYRVWTDGAASHRVTLVTGADESSVVKRGQDLWIWSSAENTAQHVKLPAEAAGTGGVPTPQAAPTPGDIADQVLKALDPTTEVTTTRTTLVAGRASYELVLKPKQAGSKVGSVKIALDAETKVPLRVSVATDTGATALEAGFTSISFDTPDAAVFAFAPPAGAQVTEETAPARPATPATAPAPARPGAAASSDDLRVVGDGWTSVLVARASGGKGAPASARELEPFLRDLPAVSGGWGSGRLFDGPLVSVLLTDDGRLAAGAVKPELLYAALGAK